MRQAIKRVLPASVLPLLRGVRDRVQLVTTPRRELGAASLGDFTGARASAIFGDAALGTEWIDSRAQLNQVFGDVERLGGVNPGDRRALYYLVRGLRPRSILEIGTHVGASTLHMGRALRVNGDVDARLTTVDIVDVNAADAPWRQAGLAATPEMLAAQAGCADLISFQKASGVDLMSSARTSFDLIFLDGDHSAGTVYNELAAALRVLSPGGHVVLHDYYPGAAPLFPGGDYIAGPFLALRRARAENPDIGVVPLGELPWSTKLGSRMTSLAVVHRVGTSAP